MSYSSCSLSIGPITVPELAYVTPLHLHLIRRSQAAVGRDSEVKSIKAGPTNISSFNSIIKLINTDDDENYTLHTLTIPFSYGKVTNTRDISLFPSHSTT
jgi:alpha-glucuronidase